MKQILQEQPNRSIQRQYSAELYHTRPYVSRPLSSISLSPSSPSMSTIPASPSPLRTPTPSLSYYFQLQCHISVNKQIIQRKCKFYKKCLP